MEKRNLHTEQVWNVLAGLQQQKHVEHFRGRGSGAVVERVEHNINSAEITASDNGPFLSRVKKPVNSCHSNEQCLYFWPTEPVQKLQGKGFRTVAFEGGV